MYNVFIRCRNFFSEKNKKKKIEKIEKIEKIQKNLRKVQDVFIWLNQIRKFWQVCGMKINISLKKIDFLKDFLTKIAKIF